MKKYFDFLKWTAVFGGVIFLYAFASVRHGARATKAMVITFENEIRPFISESAVNKLLIQNHEGATNLRKETLALSTIEEALEKDQMIAKAEVYLTVDGTLSAEIEQRSPIARTGNGTPFYIDTSGMVMPISENYAARVPLIYGIDKTEIDEVFPLLKRIHEDSFLKQQVTAISRTPERGFELSFRVYDFRVLFGTLEKSEMKIKNFKAFYQKALKDNSLKTYQTVNLQFDNQVVCTPKKGKK